MILLDTHIRVWWVSGNKRLTPALRQIVEDNKDNGLGVSIISCWEVAKLVEHGKLVLAHPIKQWMKQALAQKGVQLLDLTPQIVIESTQLPGTFHRDPADQMIVATARVYGIGLLTVDTKIRAYPHVTTL